MTPDLAVPLPIQIREVYLWGDEFAFNEFLWAPVTAAEYDLMPANSQTRRFLAFKAAAISRASEQPYLAHRSAQLHFRWRKRAEVGAFDVLALSRSYVYPRGIKEQFALVGVQEQQKGPVPLGNSKPLYIVRGIAESTVNLVDQAVEEAKALLAASRTADPLRLR